MNPFLILIPQSLNSQFLNLAPYSHYDEDGVQKSDLVLRSNNEVWNMVCLSALLTTTMPMMKQTIDAVVESSLRDRVKIMVGGALVTKNYANEIGADGYAPDAGSATKLAKALLQ
jgi:5-methyltetrahydrofolate--homocysteine methyltransferase